MKRFSRSPDPPLSHSPPPPLPTARAALIACLLAITLAPATAQAETLSIQQFMALQPQWKELEAAEKTFRVEGRVEAVSSRLIRLRKCPLAFEPATEDFPRLGQGVKRLLITGRLDHHAGEQFFRVFTVEKQPSDHETYAIQAAAVDPADSGDWHALADWAGRRGRFYEDPFLLTKAEEARHNALAVQRVAAAGDREALKRLAEQAEGFGETGLAREIRHETLRLRWETIRQTPDPNAQELITDIRETLPGANLPIAAWPRNLQTAYADQPVATYNRAEKSEYDALDRLFLAEVLLAGIERRANENGSNGEAIAAEIESVLPERTELAESYRLREIEYRLANIDSATRNDALSLASQLEDRRRPHDARRALSRWLKVREAAARRDGPAGLISVAEDYLTVLEDRDAAARLLIEAAKANPDSEEIPEKLRRIGYQNIDGQWLSPEAAAARPVDPLTTAMREGRVTSGMNPAQVEKTLGKPDRLARSASRTQIHMVWLYGDRSGLAIHFIRRTNVSSNNAQVVEVGKWSAGS